MAGSAYPDALGPSTFSRLPYWIWRITWLGRISIAEHRTSRRALLALVAGADVHIALFGDFLKKRTCHLHFRFVLIHLLPHYGGWVVVLYCQLPLRAGGNNRVCRGTCGTEKHSLERTGRIATIKLGRLSRKTEAFVQHQDGFIRPVKRGSMPLPALQYISIGKNQKITELLTKMWYILWKQMTVVASLLGFLKRGH